MKLFSWLFIATLALVIIVLSIGNKAAVIFSLYPLPFEMELPLYILILGGAFLGVLLGSLRTWISDGKARKENRAYKQEILRLKAELARLESEQAAQTKAVAEEAQHLLKLADPKHSSTG